MLSNNPNKLRRKPGAVTVAVLSLLLGAQIAALADYQYSYNYGFNRSQDAIGAIGGTIIDVSDITYVTGYFQGACNSKFGIGNSDDQACLNGGQVALNLAIAASHYTGYH